MKDERGLASGLLNSSAQVGTATGLAVLFTVAAARADTLTGGGEPTAQALVAGYKLAFFFCAELAVVGAFVAHFILREKQVS